MRYDAGSMLPEHEQAVHAAEQLASAVEAAYARVRPQLPDIDPSDLVLILQSVLRPPGSGRVFFLHQIGPGVYAF
jgi:hypothetical protein